ncbi:hexitol phosphatase HxpB [Rosenbergiella sp. S61]|uniref:Hexitol phosphatase HxpB n=1 Tax=Rosenbergiella gaditana TaxID=2726987 RepID=A0ABS5ST24_9GAMM|nr:hexitol phosphatase HxpB [Rosenbergiella gaditana]MBT0723229.1 hexitol phosphatase HxpB [Rosenbergiella gaditana]
MSGIHATKAVIFDMDGILINSEPYWKTAEQTVFAAHGIDPTVQQQLPDTTGLRIDQVVKLWLQVAGNKSASATLITQQIIEFVIDKIKTERPLLPGVKHALQLCQQSGVKIGLASASPIPMITTVVSLFELDPYFITLSSAEKLPYSKPHPQVYLNAANALGVDPLNCLAIEDSVNGMVAAKAARMKVFTVPAQEQADWSVWALADRKLSSLNALTLEMLQGK